MSPAPWVRIAAPAKINLHLEILGRRPDGFHEIDTLFLAIDLCDEVALRPTNEPGVCLRVSGPCASADIPNDRGNLVVRALEDELAGLREGARSKELPAGLEVELVKRVPSGAGLGGGSSDAVAALGGLDRLLARSADPAGRNACLAALGSDCVFFQSALATGFARAKGRGEEVRPLTLGDGDWWIVLLVPDVHCNTARVFAALPKPLSGDPRRPSLALERFDGTEDEVRGELFNRLEQVALQIHPELQAWRSLLDETDAEHFRMSGSGSSFFGVYRDRGRALEACDSLRDASLSRGLKARGLHMARPTGAGWLDLDSDRANASERRP